MAGQLTQSRLRAMRLGFTVLELLLALTLCAGLMVATAAAIRTTTNTVNANDWYARLTLKGRNVVMRMVDQARTADAHSPLTTSGNSFVSYSAAGQPIADSGIQFADAGPNGPGDTTPPTIYTYWWDQTKQQLLVKTAIGGNVTATGVMLDGVTNFQVVMWPGKSSPHSATYDIMLRASLLIQYTDTDPSTKTPQTVTLTGSVVPRKNVWTGLKLEYPIQVVLSNTH